MSYAPREAKQEVTEGVTPQVDPQDSRQDPPPQYTAAAGNAGVQRIEVISSHLTLVQRSILFFGVFLIAYVYGLDGQVRFTYQVSIPASPSEWQCHADVRTHPGRGDSQLVQA